MTTDPEEAAAYLADLSPDRVPYLRERVRRGGMYTAEEVDGLLARLDASEAENERLRSLLDSVTVSEEQYQAVLRDGVTVTAELQRRRDAAGGCYGCDLSIFLDTYEDADGDNTYRKVANVVARRLREDQDVETLEGVERAKAGDWLVTNPKGEQYPVSDETFRKTYRLAK